MPQFESAVSGAPEPLSRAPQEIMDKEQAMLLEELALFQSRLEGRPISTEEAMRLTIEQLVDSLFPVRAPHPWALAAHLGLRSGRQGQTTVKHRPHWTVRSHCSRVMLSTSAWGVPRLKGCLLMSGAIVGQPDLMA